MRRNCWLRLLPFPHLSSEKELGFALLIWHPWSLPSKVAFLLFICICLVTCSHCRPDNFLRVWIQKNTADFNLPSNAAAPLIMIGPGTGLAPFRSFIQERYALAQQSSGTNLLSLLSTISNSGKVGNALGFSALYTGCKHKEKDFYYGEELNGYLQEGVLSEYNVAFSRDNMNSARSRTYVQHLILEQKKSVWEALKDGGYVFISG